MNLLKSDNEYYLAGIDLGTTTLKVGIFNLNGREIISLSQEYPLEYPAQGLVENDVEKYWEKILGVLAKTLNAIDPSNLIAISVSSQAETIVPVDDKGKPLSKAIVWIDHRTKEEADEISSEFDPDELFKITGQPYCDPTWPATKIRWFKKNSRDVFVRTYKFMLIEDYIAFRFTGKIFGERTLYSSSYYYDINKYEYYGNMLDFLGIDSKKLPEIVQTGTNMGNISREVCTQIGLNKNTKYIAGALDQAAGAFGAGSISIGDITETTGTAFAMVMTLDKPIIDQKNRIPCHIHVFENKYCLLPYSTAGGMVLKWFKDAFFKSEMTRHKKDIYSYITDQAGKVKPGCDGLIMLPHLLGAFIPENNPKARGVFFGININHTRAHFSRAILESIGFMLRRDIEIFNKMGFKINNIISLGGGSKSRLWNQIKADITGLPIQLPAYSDTALLGAAMIAGIGAGIYKNNEEVSGKLVKFNERYEPDLRNKDIYDVNFNKYQKIYSKLKDIF
jgi:xylulokinase